MDARLPVIFALSLVLAGCGNLPSKPKASAKSEGLEIFEQLIDHAAEPDSIVRKGDEVTYVVMPDKGPLWGARFTGSCDPARPSGSMYYKSKAARTISAFTDKVDSNDLPSTQLQVLLGSEQLRQACAYRAAPDWRVLDIQQVPDQLVLDRNSVVREGGLLKVWTGVRLAEYQSAGVLHMVGQWQQRLAVDCARQTYKVLSLFSLNQRDEVQTSSLTRGTLMAPVTESPGVQQLLVAAACQPTEAWGRLAVAAAYTPRLSHLDPPTVAPAVLAAVRDLNLPQPRLPLVSLTYRYDLQVMPDEQIHDLQRTDVFTRDSQSGLLLVQPMSPVLYSELYLTFRGLIELGKATSDVLVRKRQNEQQKLTGLTFTGDWRRMPEYTTVTYTLTYGGGSSQPYSVTTDCYIDEALPASQINPSLQGRAKRVTCESVKSGSIEAYKRFDYLEDYGLFVQAKDDDPKGLSILRVESTR